MQSTSLRFLSLLSLHFHFWAIFLWKPSFPLTGLHFSFCVNKYKLLTLPGLPTERDKKEEKGLKHRWTTVICSSYDTVSLPRPLLQMLLLADGSQIKTVVVRGIRYFPRDRWYDLRRFSYTYFHSFRILLSDKRESVRRYDTCQVSLCSVARFSVFYFCKAWSKH